MEKQIRLIFALFILWGITGYSCPVYGQVLENYDPNIEIIEKRNFFEKTDQAEVNLDMTKFTRADLKIKLPADAALFFDGELWIVSPRDTVMYIGMADLISHFPDGRDRLKLSVYKKGIKKNEISVTKGVFIDADTIKDAGVEETEIRRDKDIMKDFFFLAVLLILLLVAILRSVYPSVFTVLLRSGSVFSAEGFWEPSGMTKMYSSELLFFIILVNMAISLILMVYFQVLEIPLLGTYITSELNYLFLIWLSASILLTMLAFLKVLWIKINTFIFGIRKFEFPHFFFLLRLKGVGLAVVIFLLILLYSNTMMTDQTYLIYTVVGFLFFYLTGILLLLLWMAKKIEFKIYHLFSYLCTSELIPFLAICKLVLG